MPEPAYRFFKDFDAGMVRQPEGGGRFEAYHDGLWHHVDDIDPVSGSISEITREQAERFLALGGRALDAPNDDAGYAKPLEARHG